MILVKDDEGLVSFFANDEMRWFSDVVFVDCDQMGIEHLVPFWLLK